MKGIFIWNHQNVTDASTIYLSYSNRTEIKSWYDNLMRKLIIPKVDHLTDRPWGAFFDAYAPHSSKNPLIFWLRCTSLPVTHSFRRNRFKFQQKLSLPTLLACVKATFTGRFRAYQNDHIFSHTVERLPWFLSGSVRERGNKFNARYMNSRHGPLQKDIIDAVNIE